MSRAYCLIRAQPWYRREAFEAGLRKAGYEVSRDSPSKPGPGDLLLIWNRYGGWHEMATRFERDGGRVLVAENGYIGRRGSSPKFEVLKAGPQPEAYYALGRGFHNDAERVQAGSQDRWKSVGVELSPWRTEGEHILVVPNRSFGVPGRMMAPDWAINAVARLRKQTTRPVRVREHPGNDVPRRPLGEDLKGAWAVVAWSSSAAVHALVAGIPTFIEAPFQIVKGAGASGTMDAPEAPERLPHFEKMAWGQWQLREVESGEAFRHVLSSTW